MILSEFEQVKMTPPHDKDIWVKCLVKYRNNETGEAREAFENLIWEEEFEEKLCLYIWQEGNFSCDCNRYLFFQRAKGEDEIDDDCKCGHSKFDIQIYNPLNGELLYNEFD